jgi:hypothetical protein
MLVPMCRGRHQKRDSGSFCFCSTTLNLHAERREEGADAARTNTDAPKGPLRHDNELGRHDCGMGERAPGGGTGGS